MDKYSIYVHIPFCKARCGYCAFSSCTNYDFTEGYFEKLFDEIRLFADKVTPIFSVYIGGGTPSSVGKEWLDKLFAELRANFNMSSVQEITVECNPESASAELLRALKSNGVNRLSFGLQSVNDATLKRIGRVHRYEDFLRALNVALDIGFYNINADLIIGLPEEKQDFFRSVETITNLPLSHVSAYALELHENSPIYDICAREYNYTDDELAEMYDNAYEVFKRHGFIRYETSNFAKKGYECKHNLNYWEEGRYYAFGAAACGFVGDVRYSNPFAIEEYLNTPTKLLHSDCDTISIRGQANEYVMLGLRLDSGISLDDFCYKYNVGFYELFPNARRLVSQGFLAEIDGRIVVPFDKFYVVNSILCELIDFDE